MSKLITFCVFGNAPIFRIGALKNAELAQSIYPNWICRFYLFKECHDLETELLKFPNTEVCKCSIEGGFHSTLYRFLPLGESNVSHFISRDTDSRLSIREKEAVDQWVDSGKFFHIMKDHPYHYTPEFPILAGMWGGFGGIYPEIKNHMTDFVKKNINAKGIDQKFLYEYYNTKAKGYCFEHNHTNFPSERNFERDGIYFVGQVIDENGNFGGNWKNDLKQIGILYEQSN